MKFEIRKEVKLFIDAWRVAADILDSCDMDDFAEIHGGDERLLLIIDKITDEMRNHAEDIEKEQLLILEKMQKTFDKKFSK